MRLTSGWTDLHVTLFLALTSLGLSASQIGQHPRDLAIAMGLIATAVVVGASFTDGMGGLVAGLAGGAASLAFQGFDGHLSGHSFGDSALEFGLIVVLGASVGASMDRVHRSKRISERLAESAVSASEGSLGLLTAADAEVRLAEERTRAELHHRPLSTARIGVTFCDGSLGVADRQRTMRAVARIIETDIRATDIPYAIDEFTIGVILPETPHDIAADVIESTLMLARQNTYADRVHHERRTVDDVADITVEVAGVHAGPSEEETASASGDRKPAR